MRILRSIHAILTAALAVAVGLLACDQKPKGDPAPPRGSPRVVVLSPAIATIMRDLGAADMMVGRHGFDAWSDATIPVCGDQLGPDLEAIERVDPTHVLVQPAGGLIPTALSHRAAARGYDVRSLSILTLDDIREAVRTLGELTGRRERAAELDAACALAWPVNGHAGVPGAAGGGRVLLLHTIDPPAAFGPGSFHYQVLERIGATPAILEGRPYITLDAEAIVRLAPEVIVLVQPREPGTPAAEPSPSSVIARLGGLAKLDLPALRTQRLALIDDPEAALPGTNMLRFTELLREAISVSAVPRP
ncbi:MAG: ABC transporter substrate-binding protein [Phycisphaerales bacterium]